MPISPLDAYEDHFPVGYVAFYRKTLEPTHLIRALVRVLADYPLLTGRMVRGQQGFKAIALDDSGLEFEQHETLETLHDWRAPDRNRIGRFVRMIPPQIPLRSRRPLVSVRLTQLEGGGSVLGLAFGHVLADGSSIARFLGDWARAARGEAYESPLWDRQAQADAFRNHDFDALRVPVEAPVHLGLREATLPELGRLYAHLLARWSRWETHTIPLRAEAIARLKSLTNAGHTEAASSNDILSAYLFKLYTRGLSTSRSQRARFFGVSDLRRHTSGVPERGLFGNMSGHLTLRTTTKDLAGSTLREVALEHRRQTRAIAPTRFLEQEVWLWHRQHSGRMSRVLGAEPYAGDVAVSNCRFIPFYEMDFGGGRPFFFNLPAEKFPRTVIWPAPDGEGCVLNVTLPREVARFVVPLLMRRNPLSLDSIAHG